MLLRLSYADGHRLRTVSIRAPRGTTWGAIAPWFGPSLTIGMAAEYAGASVPLTPDLILGEPPLVHGVVVARLAPERTRDVRAPVSVRVTSGPDAGGSYPLRPGHRLSVGRGQWCDVVVDDASLSRHHLSITTTRDGIVVEDASSTNGSVLHRSPIMGPTLWPPGVPLRAGATTLELSPEAASLPRGRPDGCGRVVVTARPHPPVAVTPVALSLPEPSAPTAPVPPSVLGWLLPLVVSVVLAVVLSMPTLMLFGLMAPAMSLGGYAGERRRYRRSRAAAASAHRKALAATRSSAHDAVAHEVHQRQERIPDLAHLIRDAQTTGELLWSADAATPIARVGLGTVTTGVTVDDLPETADYVPVEINLAGGVALVGPPVTTQAIARSLLIQMAIRHAPSHLRISVAECLPPTETPSRVGNRAAHWDWLAWLPHTQLGNGSPDAALLTLHDLTDDSAPVTDLANGPQGGRDVPQGVGAAHDTRPWSTGGTFSNDEGPPRIPLILCRSLAQAPDVATTVVVQGAVAQVVAGGQRHVVLPDRLSEHRAARVARALAPLSDGGGESDVGSLPDAVPFASIAPVPLDAAALARSWTTSPRSTRFVLGRASEGALSLDLATDGPHALVAGTTGSGKSELLRTLVTSLALANRPDELVMVLVDYKGGSAFAEAAALPHVVGVITDLDPHLADRALTSLTAELKRRERVLAEAGAPDLPAHQALTDQAPLARLVIVIDEFRALAEELPSFLDGLVRIAALGRSLGVHLVLATQRPGGVISADVRANVNLRIALRVRDGSDSYDVIDSPAAADLPEGLPGRALIRTGASPPRAVQVATTSTSHLPGPGNPAEAPRITPVTDLWAADTHEVPGDDVVDDEQPSTLALAAAVATEAASLVGAVPPPSPWLPALPTLIPLTELGAHGENTPATCTAAQTSPGERTAYSVPLLLSDLPADQARTVHHWRPLADGHLGVVGAGRTGRSSVVRTVLAGVLSGHPDDAHCYVFDLAGGLGPVGDAPHVGAVLGAADVALGCRVIAHLTRLVGDRQRDLGAAGYTSLAEQRASAERPWPLVFVVVDGWPRFVELYGEVDRGRPLEQLLQVLREGLGAGVVAVITGDRSLLSGRVAPLLPELWSLRLTDPSDLLMAGLTRAQVPVSMPPGRVVRVRDGVVGQVAVVGSSGEGADQVGALSEVVRASTRLAPADGPAVFARLPRAVALHELDPQDEDDREDRPPADGLLVGVGGDGAEPVAVPIDPHSGTVIGVLGPPRSGRSTALATVVASAGSRGWTVIPVTADHVRDPASLETSLGVGSAEGVLVAVDGLDQIAQTAVEDVLLSWVDEPAPTRGCRALVVAGGPEDFGGFRGIGARVQRERTGIVLQPTSPADGSGLGVAVPTGDEQLPGRGVLVVRGTCAAVQVARAE